MVLVGKLPEAAKPKVAAKPAKEVKPKPEEKDDSEDDSDDDEDDSDEDGDSDEVVDYLYMLADLNTNSQFALIRILLNYLLFILLILFM